MTSPGRRLAALVRGFWQGPPGLPRDLNYEWRFIAMRWLGIASLGPILPLFNLPPDRLVLGYSVLVGAAAYNLALQFVLPRHPRLFRSGYLTALLDALLDVLMIEAGGGFDTPFYYILFSVTLAVAMRYGYGPSILQSVVLISFDGVTSTWRHGSPDAPFLIRSLFLAMTGILGAYLREQALRAEHALKERLRQTAFLNESIAELSASLDLQAVLTAAGRRAGELFGARCVAIRPAPELSSATEATPIIHWHRPEDETCHVQDLSRLLLSAEVDPDPSSDALHPHALTSDDMAFVLMLAVPTRSKSLGSLAVAVPMDRSVPLPDGDVVASFVEQTALSLENASLYQTLADLYLEVGRRAEALRQSESYLRAIQDHMADGIIATDDQGLIQSFNPAAERILGYRAEEVLGQHARLLTVEEDAFEVQAITGSMQEVMEGGQFRARELLGRRRDASVFPMEVDATSMLLGSQRMVIFSVRDITERKETEEALTRSEKLRALGQLASGVAHDLNQSLALVTGHTELALRALDAHPDAPETVREALPVVLRAALDGAETVKRLLTFGRAPSDAGRTLLDLGTLLHETTQLTAPHWRDAAQAEARPISLEVEIAGSPTIQGWPAALREALTNLVLNAADAMPQGGVLRLVARSEGSRAVLEVQDSGVGMAREVQAKVFEPFFTTKGERGTGLGLAVVFGIVERHGGQVSVQSTPGEGSTFRLDFPAADTGDVAPTPPVPTPAPLAGLRVLAVDDEPALARLAALMLEQDGHAATVATSGEEALRRLAAEPFDLVISDVGMGEGMNGWELAAQVRERWPGVRIVLATGWGAQIDLGEARTRGVDAVLAKPYRQEDLREALTRLDRSDDRSLERAA